LNSGLQETFTYEANQVQSSGSILRAFATFNNRWIIVKLTFFDGNIDADYILPNDATSSDIQMTVVVA